MRIDVGEKQRHVRRSVWVSLGVVLGSVCIAHATPAVRTLDTTRLPHTRVSRDAQVTPEVDPTLPSHDAVVALINPRGFACSGVLVHERGVLSARHCIGATHIVLGSDAGELRAVRRIKRAVTPPNVAFDVALFVLEETAPVDPYPLHDEAADTGSLRIVGFGCTDAECRAGSGRRTYFDVTGQAKNLICDGYSAARTGCIIGHELVLMRGQAPDTCTGDSGGPVLERTDNGWTVIAITSRAVSDSVLQCGDGGIYVRVGAYEAWLSKELKRL